MLVYTCNPNIVEVGVGSRIQGIVDDFRELVLFFHPMVLEIKLRLSGLVASTLIH